MLPTLKIIPLAKLRLLAGAPLVPFALMTADVIFSLNKKKHRLLILLLTGLIIIPSMLVSLRIFRYSVNTAAQSGLYANIWFPPNLQKALVYFKNNVAPDSIILSDEYVGNVLPTYAPVISYFGHINLTYNFKQKQNNVWRFYTGRMTAHQAAQFLTENKITYVYYGDDEKRLGKQEINYDFLTPVFSTPGITIYKTNL